MPAASACPRRVKSGVPGGYGRGGYQAADSEARLVDTSAVRDELSRMTTPMLIVTGDEDDGCLDADVMLKRTIPSAGLAVLPRTGHTCNLEEPEMFNSAVAHFLATVEHDRWGLRDPRSVPPASGALRPPGVP